MGLFSKKKDDKNDLPPLKFPELPKSVPSFEPSKSMQATEAKEIKAAVSVPSPLPISSHSQLPSTPSMEKPLFVKIEKYKDVVMTLNKLKDKLHDADEVLSRLNTLKDKEGRELSAWHSDLERIRNQLLDIDRTLFE